MKALQLFSEESLKRGRAMSSEEIVRFLDEFRVRVSNSKAQSNEQQNKVVFTDHRETSDGLSY